MITRTQMKKVSKLQACLSGDDGPFNRRGFGAETYEPKEASIKPAKKQEQEQELKEDLKL